METVNRGYRTGDRTEFGEAWEGKMNSAAEEMYYLMNRGYDTKSAAAFVGNHYLLSERQRLALARILSPEARIRERKEKEIPTGTRMRRAAVDGFNAVITLEVALSGSLLIEGLDGCIRDLAGLRGTYRIVDKTAKAVNLLIGKLKTISDEAVFYLDQPVSNSGRLKSLILETAEQYEFKANGELLADVDRTLYDFKEVITADAIILDRCGSWYNLNREIIEESIPQAWIYRIESLYQP